MLNIFFLTLTEEAPKWQNENGLIGTSPGLGLKPGQVDAFIDSSMIVFNMKAKGDQGKPGDENYVAGTQGWQDRITEFLIPYKNCSGSHCFDVNRLGACGTPPYGFDEGKPCVYLKLNKIYGLKNENFKDGELPENMPASLKTHIGSQPDKDQTWVECHGEYPGDIEALGQIKYFPATQGFEDKYFPYLGKTKDYISPLIAVQFANAKHNQLLHVECRAWAKNIGYNKRDRIGINHLELLILSDAAAKAVGS
jgi:sodium/potassium-transporting ATPase subunit beta